MRSRTALDLIVPELAPRYVPPAVTVDTSAGVSTRWARRLGLISWYRTFLNALTSYGTSPLEWWKNIAWRYRCAESDIEVLFVLGCPRSGTTLVQRILTVHDDYFSIEGETGLFTRRSIFGRRHLGLDEHETELLLGRSSDIVDLFERGVRYLAKEKQGRIFVEKTPQHVLRLGFLMGHFPAARFIHVLRDGRDCLASSRRHPNIPQSESAAIFARYWKRCVRAAARHTDSDRLMTVRYEDLTRAPDQHVARLMSFLGRSMDPRQLDPAAIGADRRGTRKEFSRLRDPITSASVGRWRDELSESERKVFWRIAGRWLERLGYPHD